MSALPADQFIAAREKLCDGPRCAVVFTPTRRGQRFCSDRCEAQAVAVETEGAVQAVATAAGAVLLLAVGWVLGRRCGAGDIAVLRRRLARLERINADLHDHIDMAFEVGFQARELLDGETPR